MGLGDSLRRRREGPPKGRKEKPRRGPRYRGSGGGIRWTTWLLAAVGVLVVSFGVGYLLSTQVLFPRPETAGTGIAVPTLYGEYRSEAEVAIREAGLVVGTVRDLPSMDTDSGRVLAQDPIPGQQLRRGAAVSFAVSAGPPRLRVPPVRGLGVGAARSMLESVGFVVELQQVRTDAVAEGLVARSEPEEGTARTLPAVITLVVSAGPESGEGSEEVGTDSAGIGRAPGPAGDTLSSVAGRLP
jgi:beta-lactam-binding protein with PASTA domain